MAGRAVAVAVAMVPVKVAVAALVVDGAKMLVPVLVLAGHHGMVPPGPQVADAIVRAAGKADRLPVLVVPVADPVQAAAVVAAR